MTTMLCHRSPVCGCTCRYVDVLSWSLYCSLDDRWCSHVSSATIRSKKRMTCSKSCLINMDKLSRYDRVFVGAVLPVVTVCCCQPAQISTLSAICQMVQRNFGDALALLKNARDTVCLRLCVRARCMRLKNQSLCSQAVQSGEKVSAAVLINSIVCFQQQKKNPAKIIR